MLLVFLQNLLTSHNEELEEWDDAVYNALNHSPSKFPRQTESSSVLGTYSKLSHVILKGILLLVYVKNKIYDKIEEVESSKVGAGLFGMQTNISIKTCTYLYT